MTSKAQKLPECTTGTPLGGLKPVEEALAAWLLVEPQSVADGDCRRFGLTLTQIAAATPLWHPHRDKPIVRGSVSELLSSLDRKGVKVGPKLLDPVRFNELLGAAVVVDLDVERTARRSIGGDDELADLGSEFLEPVCGSSLTAVADLLERHSSEPGVVFALAQLVRALQESKASVDSIDLTTSKCADPAHLPRRCSAESAQSISRPDPRARSIPLVSNEINELIEDVTRDTARVPRNPAAQPTVKAAWLVRLAEACEANGVVPVNNAARLIEIVSRAGLSAEQLDWAVDRLNDRMRGQGPKHSPAGELYNKCNYMIQNGVVDPLFYRPKRTEPSKGERSESAVAMWRQRAESGEVSADLLWDQIDDRLGPGSSEFDRHLFVRVMSSVAAVMPAVLQYVPESITPLLEGDSSV